VAEATWVNKGATDEKPSSNRMKFIVGGLIIAAAVIFLTVNAMKGNMQLYVTVNEFYEQQSKLLDRDLRISGLVIGDSIKYTQIDDHNSRLEFDITDDLANIGQTMRIVVLNEPIPDLLTHEAQAVVEGRADGDGSFMANDDGLFLKCPTRYEELEPDTVQ